ncbi:MAG: UDP-N-acetylmuramoyl-tripeptide--D-alanyl-D-alanine ligase [Candidatus Loosdrechtia sp.]|uniref:UDP-N-acetylmuramoyl-tripeptide--D-alanyl-D- alanine ligase n=1 Tax=Candidatus Loosdrechtia sp. TaxID=3101272 RepID=UPI003A5DFC59|nr:MAG: UDP-N-acetylmuramoyl-tripeptide--D-alanyl-D-alanine ligase [Candidatus Jettenia sp. AMX2]
MKTLSLEEVVKAVSGNLISANGRIPVINGISTDSRNMKTGDLFFALKGKQYNGHQFVPQAIHAGAAAVVVSEENKSELKNKDCPVIRVSDTITALGDLAKYYRQKLDTKIIGITGSTGKTTTKEMAYHLLSHFGHTVRSQKSFNNFIGVPLTLFEIENNHRYGILEMGTNAPGELKRLSGIGNPDVAVILTISKAHLEGLGDIEGVARAKAEILENLRSNGVFVYNADNSWCVKIAGSFRGMSVSFGFSPSSLIRCTEVKKRENSYNLVINHYLEVSFPVTGYHNIHNCLASFAICHALGQDLRNLKEAFSSFELPSMRMEQQTIGAFTIINDAYNANPESVSAALQYLNEIDTKGRKVFICGDMLELGQESALLHKEIGEKVARFTIDLLWTVGDHAYEIAKAAKLSGMPEERIMSFKNVDGISDSELHHLQENDVIVIKGSRSMHMENIIKKLKGYL